VFDRFSGGKRGFIRLVLCIYFFIFKRFAMRMLSMAIHAINERLRLAWMRSVEIVVPVKY
jgi:hypothetical protein